MRKRILKKIAILAAPVIWRRIRGRRGRHRHPWYGHPWHRRRGWHGRHRHFGHRFGYRFGRKRRGTWL